MEETVLIAEFNFDNTDEISSFVSDCCGFAVIDSGCFSTVTGNIWLDAYLDSLSGDEKQSVKASPCSTKYRFGDGDEVYASKRVAIPVFLGNVKATLAVDVVPVNIPLLLSKQSLKRAMQKLILNMIFCSLKRFL